MNVFYSWRSDGEDRAYHYDTPFRLVRLTQTRHLLFFTSTQEQTTPLCIHPFETPPRATFGGIPLKTNINAVNQADVASDRDRFAASHIPLESLIHAKTEELPPETKQLVTQYLERLYHELRPG